MPWSACRYVALLVCPAILLVAGGFGGDPPSELAAALAKKAKRALKSGDSGQAYVFYSQASSLQPSNKGYRNRAAALQLRGGTPLGTASVSSGASTEPPGVPLEMLESITARQLAGDRQLSSPPTLQVPAGRFDFDSNDSPRSLFSRIAAQFGLRIVFDSDYPQSGPPVRFHLTQVDYRQALDALQAATGSFIVPITPHAILVARDTPQKRNDLEQYVTLTLPIPQVLAGPELTEIVQVVRQATNVEKIGWDTAGSMMVIRDRISRAAPAQALLQQMLSYRPEVMIDLELLQVSDSDVINYGLSVTSAFPLVYLGGVHHSLASIPAGVTNLLTFGGGRTLIGVGTAVVQSMFNENESSGRSLFSARLKAGSGLPGTFHVGEKYPIITSGFIGGNSSNGSDPAFSVPPAITWENLGLDLKVTPRIHGSDEVTMLLEATYEVLTGQSADGIPVIQNDKLSTNIRLKNDEWAVIAGLIGDSHSKSSSGIWGLGRIPWIGGLFHQTSIDKESGSLLIGIRPHIVSIGPDESVTRPLRVGNDARPYTPL